MNQGVTLVVEVVMPRLSDSMDDGKVLAWLKQAGEMVMRGEELVEIETDKATVVYEAEGEGVLEIVVSEGTTAALGAVIARLHPGGAAALGPSPSQASSQLGEHGSPAPSPLPAVAVVPDAASGESTPVELTSTQSLIARRMADARASIPDFTLNVDVDMSNALALYRRLKSGPQPAPTLNDVIVKACALVLSKFPLANGSFCDGRFELHSRVNIGIAVATDDSLIVPTIFDADKRSLVEIARMSRELVGKVRDGTIRPAELSGATFTVSNLGMYGITSFTAIINPPQAAILAAGAVEKRPVVRNEAVTVAEVMSATLACDHRILYGAYAARFLAGVRELLEDPDVIAS